MQQIWFIAGPTNLDSKYAPFFAERDIKFRFCCGYLFFMESCMINGKLSDINHILNVLDDYGNENLIPRYKIGNPPTEEEQIYVADRQANYTPKNDGCECCSYYRYELKPSVIKNCMLKNGKYYGCYDTDVIFNTLICTEKQINEMNKIKYDNAPDGGCSGLGDFF
jgi:ribosomal protein L9